MSSAMDPSTVEKYFRSMKDKVSAETPVSFSISPLLTLPSIPNRIRTMVK